jgi:low affinity Fe/Cu permease
VTPWNRLAHAVTHHTGSKQAFAFTLVLAVGWAVAGVVGEPTRTWELAITCGVPILTLLMVLVLQHTQNRDTQAIQVKLNELLLALEEPDDQIIHAGRLGDEELDDLEARHTARAGARAEREGGPEDLNSHGG